MNILEHNRRAWNRESAAGQRWSVPVPQALVARARRGDWQVILTPDAVVPKEWFGPIAGKRVLCLASAGGQQAPVLAAAGAAVTSFDLSNEQLARDAEVAARNGLNIRIVRGDHGALLAGIMNPAFFLFDHDEATRTGVLIARHALPYREDAPDADPPRLSAERRAQIAEGAALQFSHSLQTQIGALLAAGFQLTALYEDHWQGAGTPLDALMPSSLAFRAVRMARHA